VVSSIPCVGCHAVRLERSFEPALVGLGLSRPASGAHGQLGRLDGKHRLEESAGSGSPHSPSTPGAVASLHQAEGWLRLRPIRLHHCAAFYFRTM
jgi:hypothetical protein